MSKVQTYINTYYKYAKAVEEKYNVPALVALAQSALESGFAASKPGNMMFGVKAGSTWKGEKQLLRTTEILSNPNIKFPEVISVEPLTSGKYKYRIRDWFRKYDSPYDSFKDYALFLNKNKRYSKAFNHTDPYLFAKEVAKAGYATDPNYYNKVKKILDLILKKKDS